MGREGGLATFLKHGREHMARIGRKGFDTLVARHFLGDEKEATAWLRKRASEKQINRMVAEKLDARIAAGEKIACEELPIVMDPDSDPFFEEATRWVTRVAMSKKPKLNEVDIPF